MTNAQIKVLHLFSPCFIGYTVDVLCVAGGFVVKCPSVLVDIKQEYFSTTFAKTVEQLAIKASAAFGIQDCRPGEEYEILHSQPALISHL